MCTYTTEKPKLQIADKDIVVYKLVNIEYESIPFLHFFTRNVISLYISLYHRKIYKPNTTYRTYLNDFVYSYNHGKYSSSCGFYSFKDKKLANVKCIIPKGSMYYLCFDEDNERRWVYCSDQIKIVSKL